MRLKPGAAATLLALLACASATAFSLSGRMWWDADQATVALSAHDILHGDRPVFLPGQQFLGAVENYYVALVFAVLPETVWSYRVAAGLLYVVTVLVFSAFARRAFGPKAGIVAGLWMVFGPPFFMYRELAFGGYTAIVFLGALILFILVRLEARARAGQPILQEALAAGLVVGVGFWISFVTLSLAVACFVAWLAGEFRKRLAIRQLAACAGAFVLGSLPFWIHNLQTGWATFTAPEIRRASIGSVGPQLFSLFRDGLPTLFGAMPLRYPPPMFPGARVLPLLLIALVGGYGIWLLRRERSTLQAYTALVLLTLLVSPPLLALSNSRTDFTEPRYLEAMYLGVAGLLAALVSRADVSRVWRGAALVLAIVLTIGAHLHEPRRSDFTQERGESWPLVKALRARKIDSLYASFWTAYPVSFATRREIVSTPFGLYRLTFFYADRARVDASPAPAFLLQSNEAAVMAAFLAGTPYRREELAEGSLFTGVVPERLATLRALHCVPGQEGCR